MGAQPQPTKSSMYLSRGFAGAATAYIGPSYLPDPGSENDRCGYGGYDLDRFLSAAGEAISMKFRKSECLFAQGDPADSVFYVRSGSVKLMVVSNRGKEATIGVIGVGDYCGEGCLIDEPVRLLTATAMTSGVVLRISKRSFCKLLKENFDFSAGFTRFLVTRSLKIQRDLIDQRFQSSEQRLAQLLISMSSRADESSEPKTLPKMSQETLASMVGTTRSRISFFLNKFKKAGMIDYSSGIRVNPKLEEFAG